MTSIQKTVNAPVTVELDGKSYQFDRIGLNIWCEFCDWINARLANRQGAPVELDEMLRNAMTMAGMRWLCWRAYSQKTNGPATTEQVGDLIGSMAKLTEVFEAIADLPEGDGADNESDPPQPQ